MGKKKSKTGKQKQVKTARKLSKIFAKKLGVSEGKPEAMVLDKNNSFASSTTAIKKKKARRADKNTKAAGAAGGKATATAASARGKAEREDFDRQQASMFERERFMEWKRNGGKKGNQATTTSAAVLQLQPATFLATDADKSTAQLLNEAAHQVSGLTGIGAVATVGMDLQPQQQPGMSSLAAAAGVAGMSRWAAEAEDAAEQEKQRQKNPWAVLDTGHDSDTEQHTGLMQQQQKPAFQFAAPSFSFGVNNNHADDFDTDL